MTTRPEAVEETFLALRRVMAALKTRFHSTLREHGLTFPQWVVLKSLHRRGRRTIKELAEELEVTPANVTGIVDRLERESLVARARSAEDGRVVFVRLTEIGHERVRKLLKKMPDVGQDLFEGWSEADLAQLRAALGRVRFRPEDAPDF